MPLKLKSEMPDIPKTATWYNGEVTKNELIGTKPILVQFWSVSCDLCKQAMPKVNKLCEEFKDTLSTLSVHMPRSNKDQDIEEVKKTADKLGITQPIFIDNDHHLTDAFKNEYVPTYYIFDKDGKLYHVQTGDSGIRLLRRRIKRILWEQEK
ncbi:TlpA family protein disulfide reductase [Salibacterium salarium]|uniref:TlpA family protein disulfide reductase n=1 Tax=Salibacterium salarium TaxID=284579 RepID=A0A428MWC6_9BACI|nr:TlpA disulfide reductase family protein [Salibacterium salarium]RSL30432.1 TlpA family protein disulfide reductase [Salibacterium salarium]